MSEGIKRKKVQEVSPRVASCLPVAGMFFCLSGLLFVNPDAIAADGDKLWDWEAMPVTKATYDQKHVRLTTDGHGGAIMVWQDHRSGDWDIYAQRLDYDGNPLWTDDGVIIATSTTNRQLAPEITHDGAGGAVVTWWTRIGTSQYDPWMVFAQRINASGAVQWTANGVQVSTDVHITPTILPLNNLSITTDTARGAFMAFETATAARVVHINGSGVLLGPGWTVSI